MSYPICSEGVEPVEGVMAFGDGECAARVRSVTAPRLTAGWRAGPRVVDLNFLNPGAVIANFVFGPDGAGRFPDGDGYHAALFVGFGPRCPITGKPFHLHIMDQWTGRPIDAVRRRTVEACGELSHAEGNECCDAENADQYYVVIV